MKKIIIVLSITLNLVLMVTIALASGSELGCRVGADPQANYSLLDLPNLTAEQFSHIQALRQGLQKEIEHLRRDRAATEAKLQTLQSIPDPDQTAVTAKEKEILQIERKLHEEIVNATIEARKLLTAEQNAQFPEFRVVGEKGFNPNMCKLWGLDGLDG